MNKDAQLVWQGSLGPNIVDLNLGCSSVHCVISVHFVNLYHVRVEIAHSLLAAVL